MRYNRRRHRHPLLLIAGVFLVLVLVLVLAGIVTQAVALTAHLWPVLALAAVGYVAGRAHERNALRSAARKLAANTAYGQDHKPDHGPGTVRCDVVSAYPWNAPGNAAESRQDARTGRAGSDTGGGPDTA